MTLFGPLLFGCLHVQSSQLLDSEVEPLELFADSLYSHKLIDDLVSAFL